MAPYTPPSAAARTFAIPELLENILLHLPIEANTKDPDLALQNDLQPQLSLFALQRVNRKFRDLITTSPTLQRRMLEPPLKRHQMSADIVSCFAERFGLGLVIQRVRRLKPGNCADSRAQSWRKVRLHAEGENRITLHAWTGRTLDLREMTCEGKTWGEVIDWIWEGIDQETGTHDVA